MIVNGLVVTVPLAHSALLKVGLGRIPDGSTTRSRQRDRRRESARVRLVEGEWTVTL